MTFSVLPAGPEHAFGVTDVLTDRLDVTARMPTGARLSDRRGTPLAGALGVLVDNVLGYALIRAHPDAGWSVSSEISIDVVRPLEFDAAAGPLHATSTGEVRVDGLGGHVSGEVTDADGATLATCSERGRWIPRAPTSPVAAASPVDVEDAGCVEDLLGGTPVAVEGGAVLRLEVTPSLTNPLGNLHGGLSLCAADLAASAAVRTWDAPWCTESLRIQYLRPVPAGSLIEFRAHVRHAGRTRAVVDVAGTVGGRLCTLAHVSGRPGVTSDLRTGSR